MASFLSPLAESAPLLGSPASGVALVPFLQIAEDGTWFALGDEVVDLAHRKPLTRLLRAMLTQALAPGERGRAMSRMDLVEAGWPGERMLLRSSRIRLRVAISTLRGLGLGARIVTTSDGYALDGPVRAAPARTVPPIEHLAPTGTR